MADRGFMNLRCDTYVAPGWHLCENCIVQCAAYLSRLHSTLITPPCGTNMAPLQHLYNAYITPV